MKQHSLAYHRTGGRWGKNGRMPVIHSKIVVPRDQ